MKVCAIVAEYNPLHHGHRHQLEKAREITGCDYVVAIMSGNFTQRGNPALVDKWARTRMALAAGIDLVLELPAGYAVQPAEWFARGALGILNGLGVVTHLSFGAETDDPGLLSSLASLLLDEPEALSRMTKEQLARGKSHPAARAEAVARYLRDTAGPDEADRACRALCCPNNILGILYIQAIQALGSPIEPVLVRRVGSGYHAQALQGTYSSATAIRRAVFEDGPWQAAVPEATEHLLADCFSKGHGPLDWRDFEKMLLYRLRTLTARETEQLPDMAEGLHNRIAEAAASAGSWTEFMEQAKVKRYAAARLRRAAVHALLGVTHGDMLLFRGEFPRYARVLGFRSDARPLLSRMDRSAVIPVITRPGRFQPQSAALEKLWSLDVRATDVYSLALRNEKDRRSGRDYSELLIRL